MWGVNGPTHNRAMGNHWLVALLFLPYSVVAYYEVDIRAVNGQTTDGQVPVRVQNFDYNWDRDIVPIRSDIHIIQQELLGVGPNVAYISDDTSDILRACRVVTNWLKNVTFGLDTYADGSIIDYDKSLRVQDRTANDLLRRLIQNTSFIPFDQAVYLANPSVTLGSGQIDTQLTAYLSSVDRLNYLLNHPDSLLTESDIKTQSQKILQDYGSWRWFPYNGLYRISFRDLAPGYSVIQNRNFTNNIAGLGEMSTAAVTTIQKTRLAMYRDNYYHQYGVFPHTLFVSNFLYSAIQGSKTNSNILSNLNSQDFLALLSDRHFSNNLHNTAVSLDKSYGVNTNGVYLGSFQNPTNLEEFLDITTNNFENTDVTQVSSDFSVLEMSNKVSRVNFNTYLGDYFHDFIDEVNQSYPSKWVIRFGTVTLGDFSYTVDDLEIERNETYLAYTVKFFGFIKVLASIVFFLVLWRALQQAVD